MLASFCPAPEQINAAALQHAHLQLSTPVYPLKLIYRCHAEQTFWGYTEIMKQGIRRTGFAIAGMEELK